jgi:uncharacterized protein YbbK (DUF523 family)
MAGLQDGRKDLTGSLSSFDFDLLDFVLPFLQSCNPAMQKILISSCLLGDRVRYHGGDAALDHPLLRRWQLEGRLVPVCPEVSGGLTTPRPPAELTSVPTGQRVITVHGEDVTAAFGRGAQAAADLCAASHAQMAILKDGSPSCGSRMVYDGTFSGRLAAGEGMTAKRLRGKGVRVFSENELEEAAAYLAKLEADA